MANCSDNSYVIYYTNLDQGTIQIQKSALITDELDIALIGKTRLEYGEIFNENIVHILENFACNEQAGNPGNPDLNQTFANLLENPTVGQIWYNKTQQKPFVYVGDGEWRATASLNDVGGNSGVIMHGQFLPLPIGQDGYNFTIDECTWTVSPFHIPSEIDFMHCFSDPVAKVTMQYRLEGNLTLTDGFANYQIIGIRNNINLGEISCQSGPAPTSTPAVSATPTPTPTPTVTFTPTITPTVTVTATATVTPTVTLSNTPAVSATPTPTATPNPTISPTITQTSTATPTPTITPTLTPTTSLTPTPTPTQPVNDGSVFAVAVRPNDVSFDGEAYYVRKVRLDNTFDPSYTDTTFYNDDVFDVEPATSQPGYMMGDQYIAANNAGIGMFGVNLAAGIYNTIGITSTGYQPQQVATDGIYIYSGEVNFDSFPTFNARVQAYAYDGASTIAPVGTPYLFPSKYIVAIHSISFNTVLVVTANDSTSTSHTWTALTFDGGQFTADTNVLNISDGTDNIACLNQSFIAYATSDNELLSFRYVTGSGFLFNDGLEYAAQTASLDAIQFDISTGKLMVAYTPTGSTTTTVLQCVTMTSNVLAVEQSTTINKPFITSQVRSIAADRGRVLALDGTNPTSTVMNVLTYNSSTGFTVVDTIPVIPTGRQVVEVAFVNPNLPIPTPLPTPTPTRTPSATPPVTATATVTPSVTPSVTPPVSPTPSAT